MAAGLVAFLTGVSLAACGQAGRQRQLRRENGRHHLWFRRRRPDHLFDRLLARYLPQHLHAVPRSGSFGA
jgi:hypothetical protein